MEKIAVAPESTAAVIPTDLLTASEVARRLGVAKSALYEWLARGDIAFHRVGRLIRIRESDVAAYLAGRRVPTRPAYGRSPTT